MLEVSIPNSLYHLLLKIYEKVIIKLLAIFQRYVYSKLIQKTL